MCDLLGLSVRKAREPLLAIQRREYGIVPTDIAHGLRGQRRVRVSRVDRHRIGNSGEPHGETFEQLSRVSTWKVRSTATVKKKGVAGDEISLEQDALTTFGVTGSVDQDQFKSTDKDCVSCCMSNDGVRVNTGALAEPAEFGALYVNRHVPVL